MRAVLAVLMFVVAPTEPALGITLADGQVHVIDASHSYPSEDVIVQDGPGGSLTSVSMLPGGEVGGGMRAEGSSQLSISGGAITGPIYVGDSSTAVVSGGAIYGLASYITGQASMSVSDGTLRHLFAFNDATIDILGGIIELSLHSFDNSLVTVSGGEIVHVLEVANFSTMNFLGGSSQGAVSSSSALLNISGGSINGQIVAQEASRVNISGGTIAAQIIATGTSQIQIRGGDFNFPFGDISSDAGTLSGILLDGTPIQVSFGRGGPARITLVPEPTTALCVLAGLAAIATIRSRLG